MENSALDISVINLSLSLLFLLIPLLIFWNFKVKASKKLIIAVIRMFAQLFMVGLYLEFIFNLNNIYLNFAYLLVMISIAVIGIGNSFSVKKSLKELFRTVFPAVLIPFSVNIAFFTLIIIGKNSLFSSKYVIPLGGMLLGNTMNANIIAINNFNERLKNDYKTFLAYLSWGAKPKEALTPFLAESLHLSIKPIIANIANIGLVTLPGMMTGQILGGSSPIVAIKYQITVMLAIFSTMCFSVFLSLKMHAKNHEDIRNLTE